MVHRFIYLLLCLSAIWMVGCGGATSDEDTSKGARSRPAFTDVTNEAGLGSFRHVRGAYGRKLFPESMGAGGGFLDYDGDGRLDLLLVGGGYWSHHTDSTTPAVEIYRNVTPEDGEDTGIRFRRRTEALGLADVHAYPMGVQIADLGGDGDPDFYLTTLRRDRLFENRDGRFVERTREAGLDPAPTWSTASVFFDPDRDGDLDLYVGKYVRWSREIDVACSLDEEHLAYCTPEIYEGLPARYYENQGDGTFEEKAGEVGIAPESGMTMGAVPLDYDRDGWVDLAVANDTQPDLLYHNLGDGTFREVGIPAGVALAENGTARAGMGIDAGVVDSTGRPTLFVGNFSEERMSVFRYQKGGAFVDRERASRLARRTYRPLTFGLVLADLDLDTDLDLLVGNGHIQKEIEHVREQIRYRQVPRLFVNDGTGRFSEPGVSPGPMFSTGLVARGVAYGDVDGDGDQDILVTENGGPVHLWRNDSAGNGYLRVRLRASESAPSGIGARVSGYAGGRVMHRHIRTGGSYLSSSETRVATFGLGARRVLDSLIVQWPSGRLTRRGSVESGQELLLREQNAGVPSDETSNRTAALQP